jgi:hypothetical protein
LLRLHFAPLSLFFCSSKLFPILSSINYLKLSQSVSQSLFLNRSNPSNPDLLLRLSSFSHQTYFAFFWLFSPIYSRLLLCFSGKLILLKEIGWRGTDGLRSLVGCGVWGIDGGGWACANLF